MKTAVTVKAPSWIEARLSPTRGDAAHRPSPDGVPVVHMPTSSRGLLRIVHPRGDGLLVEDGRKPPSRQ
jgi:hypothetical protein